jgi:hypothetical protein
MSKTDEKVSTEQEKPSIIAGVRCRFFAQYWGVKALYVGGDGIQKVGEGGWNLKHPDFFLKLKQTKWLTDIEVTEIASILKIEDEDIVGIIISDEFLNAITAIKENNTSSIHLIDYLRSKGYAVPFMSYSVQDLVDMGWVQF